MEIHYSNISEDDIGEMGFNMTPIQSTRKCTNGIYYVKQGKETNGYLAYYISYFDQFIVDTGPVDGIGQIYLLTPKNSELFENIIKIEKSGDSFILQGLLIEICEIYKNLGHLCESEC